MKRGLRYSMSLTFIMLLISTSQVLGNVNKPSNYDSSALEDYKRAETLLSKRKIDSALFYLESAFGKFKQENDTLNYLKTIDLCIKAYYISNKYEDAYDYANQLLNGKNRSNAL